MEKNHVDQVRAAVTDSLNRIEDHWFVRDAHLGALSREQAIRWVMCAGRESRSFPTILSNMIETTDDTAVRAILQENLDDEYGNGDPEQAHFRHYVHLLADLGFSEADVEAYEERAGIRLALDLASNTSSQQDAAVSLGYMLVNEGMTPITYGAVGAAITTYYPGLDTSFFVLHVEVDKHHVEELYNAVALTPDDALDGILFGVALGERGMAVLLDEALGVFDHVAGEPVAG